jgi:predicted anti-sigma-YlaC factor YlaD
MSKNKNTVRRLACRLVRRWLQERNDREGTTAGGVVAASSAVETHLQGCPACRRFQEFLDGYGRELAASLDGLYAARPAAAGLTVSARDAPVRWARRPAARWAIPAAAALLVIAAGTQVPRLAAGTRVERQIRREVTTLVEAVYSRPLAQGVETALAGGSMLEGLAEGDGLQGLGEGEDYLTQ